MQECYQQAVVVVSSNISFCKSYKDSYSRLLTKKGTDNGTEDPENSLCESTKDQTQKFIGK